jgi:uncharacterized protein (DUF433 family)
MTTQLIVKDRDILGGVAVFRGTRVPFQTLLDYLEGGQSLDEFLDDFPTVSREAAIAALEQAKTLLVDQLGGKSCSTSASLKDSLTASLGTIAPRFQVQV